MHLMWSPERVPRSARVPPVPSDPVGLTHKHLKSTIVAGRGTDEKHSQIKHDMF